MMVGRLPEEEQAKRSLGFVFVTTIIGPQRSPRQTQSAHMVARQIRRRHPTATASISFFVGGPPGPWRLRSLDRFRQFGATHVVNSTVQDAVEL
jgi:hypothetical protein